MNQRVVFLLAACCLVHLYSFSQVRMAILGGPQSSSVIEKNNLPGWESAISPGFSSRGGFHIGGLFEIPLSASGRWFLHPGILYQTKGRKFFQRNDTLQAQLTDTLTSSASFFTNYIEIPFNLSYKIPIGAKSRFLLSAGPYISFFYSGKYNTENRLYSTEEFVKNEQRLETGNETNKIKTTDFGLNARAGFELGKVLITGFYSRGLTNFYKASYDGTFNHKVIGASIGFWLSRPAEIVKKPKDRDKDGVPDTADACPELPGSAITKGCPDKDADEIGDNEDKCPDIAGLIKYKGCPVPDTDKDGINDEEDKCPDIAGLEKYNGCPVPDTDGDGINDELDACPDKAGTQAYKGCPVPDRDNDGVNDPEDRCPDIAGTKENNGCPEVKKEIVEKLEYAAHNIMFTINSDKLASGSFEALDEVAGLLQRNPGMKIDIEGHTDNTGTPSFNMVLSQKRADAVKAYLISKGIEEKRIRAVGFGQENPVYENTTPQGREANRRVELKVHTD